MTPSPPVPPKIVVPAFDAPRKAALRHGVARSVSTADRMAERRSHASRGH